MDRKYKPIGFLTDEWVDYEKYPIAHHFVRLSEETDGDIYLYDDDGILGEARDTHEARRVLSGYPEAGREYFGKAGVEIVSRKAKRILALLVLETEKKAPF
jgi:hypothetical protein